MSGAALRSPGTWLEHWLLTEERGTDVPAFIRAIQANARNAALEEAAKECDDCAVSGETMADRHARLKQQCRTCYNEGHGYSSAIRALKTKEPA